jgi:hypothetical protein
MTYLVRGFALVLILAGLLAVTHPQANPTARTSAAKAADMPIPVCPPNDPNACHIEQW